MNISWLLWVLSQWDMGWVETIGAWSAVVDRRCTCMYVPFTTLYTFCKSTNHFLSFTSKEHGIRQTRVTFYILSLCDVCSLISPIPPVEGFSGEWGVYRRKYMRSWVFDLRALIKGTNLFSYFNCCPCRLVWSNSSC